MTMRPGYRCRPVKRLCLPALVAALAVGLAGCTDHSKDEMTIRALVNQFASTSGPRACSMLTRVALARVYGGTHPERGRANCLVASKSFRGAPIKITNIHWTDNTVAKVSATDAAGKTGYTVTVAKFGRRWRIDDITRA
jgi:hypothetical protein